MCNDGGRFAYVGRGCYGGVVKEEMFRGCMMSLRRWGGGGELKWKFNYRENFEMEQIIECLFDIN